jgi:4-hydroxybenzoate polyprenyltransferase
MDLSRAGLGDWRVALRLGRVSNLPTVWTNVLAGTALAAGAPSLDMAIVLIVALSLFYIAGMYLNDAFDREIDARERPDRPIPAGLADAGAVFAAGFGMLGVGVVLLALLGWWPLLCGLVLAGAILYYNIDHKTNPLSPLIMGICRVLVYVTAAAAVAPGIPSWILPPAAAVLAYLIGLTYVAKQENLREIGNLWPLLFLAAPFAYLAPALWTSMEAASLYALFLAWTLYSLSFVMSPQRRDIRRAVTGFIAGIALLDGVLIAGTGAPGLALFALFAFVLTLALQRYVPGT